MVCVCVIQWYITSEWLMQFYVMSTLIICPDLSRSLGPSPNGEGDCRRTREGIKGGNLTEMMLILW